MILNVLLSTLLKQTILLHIPVISTTYVRYKMISLRTLKMKKVKTFLTTKEAVKKARVALEKKTEEALQASVHSKQKARELAHVKYLD